MDIRYNKKFYAIYCYMYRHCICIDMGSISKNLNCILAREPIAQNNSFDVSVLHCI